MKGLSESSKSRATLFRFITGFVYNIYFACFFNSSSNLKWDQKQNTYTGDTLFDYEQYKIIQNVTRNRYQLLFESCIENFDNNKLINKINLLRDSGLQPLNSTTKLEHFLLKYAGGENLTSINKELALFLELRLEKSNITDDSIANMSVKHWIKESIQNYRYPGADSFITDDCGNLSQTESDLVTNPFVLMTSKLTESVGCKKLAVPEVTSNLTYIYLACQFEQSEKFEPSCKTDKCIFGDSSYNKFCEVEFWKQTYPESFDLDSETVHLQPCNSSIGCPIISSDYSDAFDITTSTKYPDIFGYPDSNPPSNPVESSSAEPSKKRRKRRKPNAKTAYNIKCHFIYLMSCFCSILNLN